MEGHKQKMEWQVWLSDGSTRNSQDHKWADVPHGILVVRVWGHKTLGKVVSWGEAFYGRPDTWKHEARVSDDEFARVLKEAQETTIPPSER